MAELSSLGQIVSIISIVLTAAFAFWKFSTTQSDVMKDMLHTQITAVRTMVDDKIVSVQGQITGAQREVSSRIDAAIEKETKARHDLRNEVFRVTASQASQIDQIERDMVPKEDMKLLEQRLLSAHTETRTKLDSLIERFALVAVLKEQTERNGTELRRIAERLETMGRPGGIVLRGGID